MIVSPQRIINEEIITSPDMPFDLNRQVQPNGIDIRIKTVLKLSRNSMVPFKMWKSGAKDTLPVGPSEGTLMAGRNAFVLERGYAYQIECYEFVDVPRGMIAMVYGRSTLHRNGIFCRSALYDAGFSDYVGFMAFPFTDFWVEEGTRVAQIVFTVAEGSSAYNGQYGVKRTQRQKGGHA